MPSCRSPRIFRFCAAHPAARNYSARPLSAAIEALAVTDRASLAGIVRAHEAAKATGVRAIVGCRLDLTDGATLLVYPTDRASLCAAMPLADARQGPRRQRGAANWLGAMSLNMAKVSSPSSFRISQTTICTADYGALPMISPIALIWRCRCAAGRAISSAFTSCRYWRARAGVATVATNDVLFHIPDRRILQDVVTCIRKAAPSMMRASGESGMPTVI